LKKKIIYLLNSEDNIILNSVSLVYGVQRHFQQYLNYIMAVSFIDGGNRSTWRNPLPCCKSL